MLSGLLSFCVYVSYLMLFALLPVYFVLSFAFFRYEMQIVSECGCLFEPERRVGTGT